MAVEHELPVAIGAQRDKGKRRARLAREAHRSDADACIGQGLNQEMPERVIADLARERTFEPRRATPAATLAGAPLLFLISRAST